MEIPRDWLSGVYLGKLKTAETGYESYFVFIVRDDRKADFLFQCSDTTWQAYNRWPAWRSLYDWKENKWHTSLGAEISFDRPYSLYYNKLARGPRAAHEWFRRIPALGASPQLLDGKRRLRRDLHFQSRHARDAKGLLRGQRVSLGRPR